MNDTWPTIPAIEGNLYPPTVSDAEKARRRARIAQVIASFGQPAECGHKRVGRVCSVCTGSAS